ncbi:MAG: ion transporter [Mariprofundus sp.]|nr:ion transporter [Mariprofundus sp.]
MISHDRALKYHHLEWVLAHPRFGFFMMGLIAFSFTHNQALAAILFVIFAIEIIFRIILFGRKIKLNPYRSSTSQRVDLLLLVIDVVAVLSLLITVFDIQIAAENIAVARLLRGVYLMRSLRFVRYFDLHSAMFSPTYGMVISLIILVSFFAQGAFLIAIIIFFFVELSLRLIVMRSMDFEKPRDKYMEWGFWGLDLVATIFMLPFVTGVPYSGGLRMLRLVRLLRPWQIIIRNLRDVLREGQFMQEINLIVLFLAILSIGGGVAAHFMFGDFDYTMGLYNKPIEHEMLSSIWFAFRLLTDPGNSVVYPDDMVVAAFSITGVILGVFIFAFFIGIGANIVSGLMRRLRNEELLVKNHMAILGWTPASPFIVDQLRIISERTFTRLKVVLLHNDEYPPAELINEKWVTYRQGKIDSKVDLQRINIAEAKQALMVLPIGETEGVSLSHSFYNMLAVRAENKNIKLSVAIPGMDYPRLDTHQHMLQVGWDNVGHYDQPTVVMSEADFRATALCNILRYSDFDQVLQRLMIPELMDESSTHLVSWESKVQRDESNAWQLFTPDEKHSASLFGVEAQLFSRGVVLFGLITDDWEVIPMYSMEDQYVESLGIKALLGIAVSDAAIYDETMYCIRSENKTESLESLGDLDDMGLTQVEPEEKMSLLVMGWVGSLPLLLKRLLRFYHELDLVIFDDLTQEQRQSEQLYLERRLAEEPGLEDLVTIHIEAWNFNNMEVLRPHIIKSNHIILSRPKSMDESAYAMITTVLSHITTICKDEDVQPQIFPMLDNREQAGMLQRELSQYDLPTEMHVTVPNEFYGVFVAHTSFHMYAVEKEEDYQSKRAFRHALSKLMSDSGEDANMSLKILTVSNPLPEDPQQLFQSLRDAGFIWIGYTMNTRYKQQDSFAKTLAFMFPRQTEFTCARQNQIVINPNGNPYSQRAWQERRDHVVELIALGGDDDVELF